MSQAHQDESADVSSESSQLPEPFPSVPRLYGVAVFSWGPVKASFKGKGASLPTPSLSAPAVAIPLWLSDQVALHPIVGSVFSPQENVISVSSLVPWTVIDSNSGVSPPSPLAPLLHRPQDYWFKGSSTTSCSKTFRICAWLL